MNLKPIAKQGSHVRINLFLWVQIKDFPSKNQYMHCHVKTTPVLAFKLQNLPIFS